MIAETWNFTDGNSILDVFLAFPLLFAAARYTIRVLNGDIESSGRFVARQGLPECRAIRRIETIHAKG
jgi:hypothetical protein